MSDRATKISLAALMLLNILDASTTLALTDANLACEMRRGLTDELNHDTSILNADKERL